MIDFRRRLKFIESYLRNSKERIELAKISKERGFYNNTIRFCQEAVELSLKAILRLYNIEYPKSHDVGYVLRQYARLFPDWFKSKIPEIARISRDLSYNRGPAIYGDENSEVPPEELYDEQDAVNAIKSAQLIHSLCYRLFLEKAKRIKEGS